MARIYVGRGVYSTTKLLELLYDSDLNNRFIILFLAVKVRKQGQCRANTALPASMQRTVKCQH